ncbi:MAG: PepSY domain-containing protein [Magnetovibrionaceae bacterium]
MGAKAYGLGGPSLAQTVQAKSRRSADISGALSRLANNPKYRGRVLGTHIRNTRRGFVYEVRILRPDDRVILVYIDPETGGVVGDSASGGRRFSGPEGRSVKPSMPGFRQNTDRGGPLGGQRR